MISRDSFEVFIRYRFTGNAVLAFHPASEIDELATF
jgi:hypothetical protein